ncbi:MAG TPA: L-threonylcarbamoyladenylate synthase [Flavobacteriales bacterium]|nr:L-threonylcarbamoyladenylate synthase [Flavobacteriales bacterium]
MAPEPQTSVDTLKQGRILLYPTDTVWGLGCDASNDAALEKIFNLKDRPAEKSVIVLVSDMNMLGRYFKHIPDVVFDLEENSAKPITYILDGAYGISQLALHADGSLGVRIPKHEFCINLIRKFGKAIVSTSANVSGKPTPKNFDTIDPAIINSVDHCVDPFWAKKSTGIPSTIIKIKPNGEFTFIRK